jgi:hypothetical protein
MYLDGRKTPRNKIKGNVILLTIDGLENPQ